MLCVRGVYFKQRRNLYKESSKHNRILVKITLKQQYEIIFQTEVLLISNATMFEKQ